MDDSRKEEEAGGEYVVFRRMGVIRQARPERTLAAKTGLF